MDPQDIIKGILDLLYHLRSWRFSVCLFGSLAIAIIALDHISAEPLRWIVAGAIVLIGVVIGWRWNSD